MYSQEQEQAFTVMHKLERTQQQHEHTHTQVWSKGSQR